MGTEITLLQGDCREVLAKLPAESVQCVVTSPPYYGLRDYGTAEWAGGDAGCDHLRPAAHGYDPFATSTLGPKRDGISEKNSAHADGAKRQQFGSECGKCGAQRVDRQIGLEQSPAEYVAQLVEVFREVRRVLRKDGTVWLNLGSSYSRAPEKGGSGPGGKNRKAYGEAYGGAQAARKIGAGGTRPSPSRQPLRAPAYGSGGKGLSDCLAPDCACRGPYGELPGDFPCHRQSSGNSGQQPGPISLLPSLIGHDSGPLGSVGAFPGASLLDVPASKSPASSRHEPAASCLSDEASASQPSPLTSSPSTQASDRMSACISDIGTSEDPSGHRKSGREVSSAACGDPKCDGSCGVCWAYLAIPLLKFKHKDLMDIPTLVALALQADGWWIRSEIIWSKSAPMPESVRDRPTCAHEKVWLLTKAATYFYDADAVAEPSEMKPQQRLTPRASHPKGDAGRQKHTQPEGGTAYETRNLRNVWHLNPEPFPGAHFATMPATLAERCIKAGTSERGCCPHCGAAWVRTLGESVETGGRGAGNGFKRPERISRDGRGDETPWVPKTRATTGWLPSCACPEHEPVPCTVLDPFAGAGTTLLVADRLQRSAIGIELNPAYCGLIRKRLAADAPLLTEVA